MLTRQDYQDALDVQNACNLSGVVQSFSDILGRIWEEAHASGHGTLWVNQHPISVLFTNKIADLAHGDSPEQYGEAVETIYTRLLEWRGGE